MNKLRNLVAAVVLFVITINAQAQIKSVGNFMAGGIDDAGKLFEGYLSPYINAFGASLTGGWYNTAKPHKLGGFDLTFTLNTAIVPSQYKTFNVNELGLQSFALASGESNESPTVAGKKEEGPQMVYNLDGVPEVDAFRLPQGTNNPYIPSPMIQAGIGLVKETEIIGRYLPTVKAGPLSVGMWGVGVKHSLKQWIPVLSKLPVLELSIMGGYTKLHSNTEFTVDENTIGLDETYLNGFPPTPSKFTDQSMDLEVNSLTGNIIISANLPVVCFYGSAGFARTKANLKLLGIYPLVAVEGTDLVINESEKDPLDIEIKNQDGGIMKPRLNAGIRFKFAVITLHFDYTYANYSVATAGLGISFR